MDKYTLISENPESTVVTDFHSSYSRESSYQSEADLEQALIAQLRSQAYEYLTIHNEKQLIDNLRFQLEKLNDYRFSDAEWSTFFRSKLANLSSGIVEKTAMIQEDHIQLLTRDDGTVKNIYLINKTNIHNNSLQVINQYETEGGQRSNRYDVTILINGLPMVHIELKRRGVDLQEAFNQITRYDRDSFWAGSGLFQYIQLFVISNGTLTKYYSNTTRHTHIREMGDSPIRTGKRTSNSYEFTSWWADANNKPITDLVDFAQTFFAKHTLLNILTRYCVFTVDRLLLVMRPYQIVATERIVNRINVAHNYKSYGSIEAGGYIWHTTGSGKTLTSFKTAQLASKYPFIDKVIFVVDRKDLDYQTMLEYDRFEKGAANGNNNTAVLKKQLEDSKTNIIITTLQKLSILVKKYKNHPSYSQNIVLIFDECHRSQFGDMHALIVKNFKRYYMFGFTGTPIFAANASGSGRPDLKTTEQAFGAKLHTYTIIDAITDKNVLPFRIEYIGTMKEQENITDTKVYDIDREKALASPERITNIVSYILEHFDQKTKRNSTYNIKDRRVAGFNSIFAVSSIDVLKKYYTEFRRQLNQLPQDKQLKIATIFSFGVNDPALTDDGIDEETVDNTDGLSSTHRDFLESAIRDYNTIFKTNYDTSADKFQNYYKDISERVKKREVDLLLVVNMFLTGFDATTLNTLWVDKNLRQHGLLQAYSRTNRILNSVKTFGNIICFRNLETATNESLALFGNKDAGGVVLLRPFRDYYNGYSDADKEYPGYIEVITQLQNDFPLSGHFFGIEEREKKFIQLYSAILKLRNILTTFDDFVGMEILSHRDFQDYHSLYIDLYNKYRNRSNVELENINDDVVFEMELVKQVEINIDYILVMIQQYQDTHQLDKEIIVTIQKAIGGSVELRNKKELIESFITRLTPSSEIENEWRAYIETKKREELDTIIEEENLNPEATYQFMSNAFRDGFIQESGTDLAKVLPPTSLFTPSGVLTSKKNAVLLKLTDFFNRFWDISGGILFGESNFTFIEENLEILRQEDPFKDITITQLKLGEKINASYKGKHISGAEFVLSAEELLCLSAYHAYLGIVQQKQLLASGDTDYDFEEE